MFTKPTPAVRFKQVSNKHIGFGVLILAVLMYAGLNFYINAIVSTLLYLLFLLVEILMGGRLIQMGKSTDNQDSGKRFKSV
jgi:hypothetical protein